MAKDGFDAKIDWDEVDGMIHRLKKALKAHKGIMAGYYTNKRYENGLSVIENALIQEFGSVNRNIPPRPFLRNALKHSDAWAKFIVERFDPENPETSIRTAIKLLSEKMKNAIRQSIDDMVDPPNSPFTIKAKGSSHPLIDTGLLKNSVQAREIKDD